MFKLSGAFGKVQRSLFVDRDRGLHPSGRLLLAFDASKQPFPRQAGWKGRCRPLFLPLEIAFCSTGTAKRYQRAGGKCGTA